MKDAAQVGIGVVADSIRTVHCLVDTVQYSLLLVRVEVLK